MRLKAAILLNTEPAFDCAGQGQPALNQADMVVTLSPFKANMDDQRCAAADRHRLPKPRVPSSMPRAAVQSFHAVVKPLADTRPAWKVLRVLANLLQLPGFDYESVAGRADRLRSGTETKARF